MASKQYNPFEEVGQLGFDAFDIYRDGDGTVVSSPDYYHEPQTSDTVLKRSNPVILLGKPAPLRVSKSREDVYDKPQDVEDEDENDDEANEEGGETDFVKPPFKKGGSIIDVSEPQPSEGSVQNFNPFMDSFVPTEAYQPTRAEEWDFFLGKDGIEKKSGKIRKIASKRVVSTKSTASDPETNSEDESTTSEESIEDSLQGVLNVFLIQAKGFKESDKMRVMVSVHGKPRAGKKETEFFSGEAPLISRQFAIGIDDKQTEKVKLEAEILDGTRIGALAVSPKKLLPNTPKTLWLELGPKGLSIEIRADWVPGAVLAKVSDPMEAKTRVRLLPRLSIKVPSSVAIAGSTIKGTVHFSVAEAASFTKGVFAKFHGQEYVSAPKEGPDAISTTKLLKAKRDIITKMIVLTKPEAEKTKTYQPGEYTWKFSVDLPKNIPPSFSSSTYGYIRYLLYAALDDGSQYCFSTPIKILAPPPKNTDPQDSERTTKTVTAHHVSLNAKLNTWIMPVGHHVELGLKITNRSQHNLHKLKIIVKERYIFSDDHHTNPGVQTHVLVQRNVTNPAPAGKVWSKTFNVRLPRGYTHQTITSRMGGKFIRLSHYIELKWTKAAMFKKHKQRLIIPFLHIPSDALEVFKPGEAAAELDEEVII